ncbi:MAG TPA: hypothetical protein VF260_00760 [Bacilli bacterium]
MRGIRNLISLGLALGMLLYAAPRLQIGGDLRLPAVFGIVWICMALLVIAAHLHEFLGVDEENRRAYRRRQNYRSFRLQQKVREQTETAQSAK